MSHRGRAIPTGIFKEPVSGRAAIGRVAVAGDVQADPSVHGGPDQAVYVTAPTLSSYDAVYRVNSDGSVTTRLYR